MQLPLDYLMLHKLEQCNQVGLESQHHPLLETASIDFGRQQEHPETQLGKWLETCHWPLICGTI